MLSKAGTSTLRGMMIRPDAHSTRILFEPHVHCTYKSCICWVHHTRGD
jgi:hypothetical protein